MLLFKSTHTDQLHWQMNHFHREIRTESKVRTIMKPSKLGYIAHLQRGCLPHFVLPPTWKEGVAGLVKRITQRPTHRVVSVEHAISRLQDAVQEAVSRSAIPKGVKATSQTSRQFQRPIDDVRVQLALNVFDKREKREMGF